MEKNEVVIREDSALTASMVKPGEIMQIISHVHAVIKEAMTEGIDNDYGIIPGTKKKTLLKPGAEKLLLAFGLTGVAKSPSITDMPNGHREVTIETEIIHMGTGSVLAVGLGSCSTMEGKYRYRNADIVCPECEAATIIKGKEQFGGGWLCYKKKGGCGKKWTDAESPFAGVMNNKTEHDNPADYYNTVLKMASKRSMVDGAIRATASSSMFTQDVEETTTQNDTSSNKAEPTKTSDKKKLSEEQTKLWTVLVELHGNDMEAIKATLLKMTTFKAKEDGAKYKKGETIPGKSDVRSVSDAACKVTRHKVEDLIKKGKPLSGDCSECEKMPECNLTRKKDDECASFVLMEGSG